MSKKIKPGGQRVDDKTGGEKRRSATSNPHRGSRVEPSHITEQRREKRNPSTKEPDA